MERVGRDPVGAFDHDRNVVDAEAEFEMFRRFVVFQLDGADADRAVRGEELLAAMAHPDVHFIEILFAVPGRIPEFRIPHRYDVEPRGELRLALKVEFRLAATAGYVEVELIPIVQRGAETPGETELFFLRSGLIPQAEVTALQGVFRAFLQPHVAPEAAEDHPGGDVPAVAVGGLADPERFEVPRLRLAVVVERNVLRRENGRGNPHGHGVGAAALEQVVHREPVAEKGVVGLARRVAVDQNFGEAVDAFEDQIGLRREVGGELERAFVLPVVEFKRTQKIDVFAEEGVRNDAVPVKVEFDVSGHFGRNRRHVDCTGSAEEPPAVEKELFHGHRTFPVDESGSMSVPLKSVFPAFQRAPSFR